MNNKHFIFLVFLASMTGYSQAQKAKIFEPFELEGQLIGRDSGYIVLWYPDTTEIWKKDTCFLRNGVFRFHGIINQPSFVVLKGSPADGNYINFFLEKGKQTIRVKENEFQNIRIVGSKTQNQYDSLKKKIRNIEEKYKRFYQDYDIAKKDMEKQTDSVLREKFTNKAEAAYRRLQAPQHEIKKTRYDFIAAHPDSYVSPTELYSIINFISLISAEYLFNRFTLRIKESRIGKLCLLEIEKKKKAQTGNIVPDFVAEDISGDKFSLSDFKGKYILLDFWATWCIPCRKAFPHLKEIYKEYNEKDFQIISIAMDKNDSEWRKTVKKEQIEIWKNIIVNSEIDRLFQASNLLLPTQFLLDRTGTIVWNSNDENKKSWEAILKVELKK